MRDKEDTILSENQNAAIDFLLYSYFGIDAKAGQDNTGIILNGAIGRAYRDASSHVLSIEDEQEKRDKRGDATTAIGDAVMTLTNEANYDAWHRALCERLMDIYKGVVCKKEKSFTYGIAQKWVNMTMKYLYLLVPLMSEYGYCAKGIHCAVDHRDALHVPIDSYIIRAAKEEGVLVSDIDPWSKIQSYDVYYAFQSALRNRLKGLAPIEWEGPAWIKAARKA